MIWMCFVVVVVVILVTHLWRLSFHLQLHGRGPSFMASQPTNPPGHVLPPSGNLNELPFAQLVRFRRSSEPPSTVTSENWRSARGLKR